MTFLKPFQGEGQNFRIFPTRKARISMKEKQLVQVTLWQVIEGRKFLFFPVCAPENRRQKSPRERKIRRRLMGGSGIHKLFTPNGSLAAAGFTEDRNDHAESSRKKLLFPEKTPSLSVWRKWRNQGVAGVVRLERGDGVPVGKKTPRKKVVTLPIKT